MKCKFYWCVCAAAVYFGVLLSGCQRKPSQEELGEVLPHLPRIPGTETKYPLPPLLKKSGTDKPADGADADSAPAASEPSADGAAPSGKSPASEVEDSNSAAATGVPDDASATKPATLPGK